MIKKFFILVILILSLFLSSCKIKYDRKYDYEKLSTVPAQTLIDKALLVLQDKSIMSSYSFVNWSRFSEFDRNILCYYNNEFGYIREYGVNNGNNEYSIEYYKEGYLYSIWYFHLYGDEYSCQKEKKEFTINFEYYKEKADENYNLILDILKNRGFSLYDDTINGKTYYRLYHYLGNDAEYSDLNLYFNKDKNLVGCYLTTKNGPSFNINTFNLIDGTFMDSKFDDVYDWMNYPTDLDEIE